MRKNDFNPVREVGVALVLLTRLPLPRLPAAAFARQARAAWAFPLAGLAVALPACAVGLLALALGLPAPLAAGLVLAMQMLLTGAMHEDGLADTADGLWGGFDRDRRLEIMGDSRIGTYGVLALVVVTGLRWTALAALLQAGAWPAVLAVAALSRAALPMLMTALPPARDGGLSRGVGVPGRAVSLVALLLGAALAAPAGPAIALPALAAALVLVALALVARAKIGGQTGDILGAAQQLGEATLLCGLAATLG
ncbi:adenosylcobinamide-GDP ribazoletransferase [Seohaeicola saemankumensis]|nr:adenosylcobinamide-GDP ribazoletransferase [Seohaeicola saemankumensis]MCA0869693.1 adenosylcobinamide-GDP ribazoletransferase [Seohaeicola saemankumensis]